MDPRVAAILKWTVYGLLAFVTFIYVSRYHKRETRKDELVAEMRAQVSEASFYRAMTEKDARTTFLRSIAIIDDAKKLGVEPTVFFDTVFGTKKEDPGAGEEFENYPSREKLARETLMRGYLHAEQLGMLAGPKEVAALRRGDLPETPARTAIICVIDPAISPGLEKVVPNFELRPFDNKNATPNDTDIASARNLATDLSSSMIIDRETETKINEHFRPKKPKTE
ncbi:hypothetical protein OKA04_13370 [Luteolibacter flavescens]|uniref:Uncharacterized protein n=1 Tax=Luteolibacter flavescens TaxID=1859460 RepID=A0ABT3FR95_9BACT|nr:hypothetical protein [Luteolibacter flavescens]MCW1885724.1 hypothetical protein [Luteolibacter flavescens]